MKGEHYSTLLAVMYDIRDLHREVEYLRRENAELAGYRKKYSELLDSSINHGQVMLSGMLDLAMSKVDKANTKET